MTTEGYKAFFASRRGKPKPRRSTAHERDAYGSIVGSDCAAVNAVLSRTPQTATAIRRAAGVKCRTITYHLDRHVRNGVLRYIKGKGYYLP